ncbi:MAG: hypothetical protein E7173_02075 [Firmicutes bacterium]|nr:hypothetical protein [Bacillota bacterium]
MKILKRENWWIWLLLLLFSQGSSSLVLGALVDVYDKNAWYAKWQYWVIALLCLVYPALIMASIFLIQILCLTAAKLDIPGKEIYLSPYLWIIGAVIPFIGWACLIAGIIYLEVYTLIALYRGNAEKYI